MQGPISQRQKQQYALLKACRIVGSQRKLSEQLQISYSRLNKWINHHGRLKKAQKLPYQYAQAIEEITQGQVKCTDLVSDVISPRQFGCKSNTNG